MKFVAEIYVKTQNQDQDQDLAEVTAQATTICGYLAAGSCIQIVILNINTISVLV